MADFSGIGQNKKYDFPLISLWDHKWIIYNKIHNSKLVLLYWHSSEETVCADCLANCLDQLVGIVEIDPSNYTVRKVTGNYMN